MTRYDHRRGFLIHLSDKISHPKGKKCIKLVSIFIREEFRSTFYSILIINITQKVFTADLCQLADVFQKRFIQLADDSLTPTCPPVTYKNGYNMGQAQSILTS
jgi:hypothetical protein